MTQNTMTEEQILRNIMDSITGQERKYIKLSKNLKKSMWFAYLYLAISIANLILNFGLIFGIILAITYIVFVMIFIKHALKISNLKGQLTALIDLQRKIATIFKTRCMAERFEDHTAKAKAKFKERVIAEYKADQKAKREARKKSNITKSK